MANFVFKGIQQVKALPTTPEKGVIYFVREHKNGVATNDMSIYFGSRCYGKVEATRLDKIEQDILALDGRVGDIEDALGNWVSLGKDLETVAKVVNNHESRIVTAEGNASAAVATANSAKTIADEAKQIAEGAVTDVTEQVKAAEAAQAAAESAQTAAAGSASAADASAQSAAGSASAADASAQAAAGSASAAAQSAADAEAAQAKAEAAQAAAEAAKEAALNANTSATAIANEAKDIAGSANTKAENAVATANSAMTYVNKLKIVSGASTDNTVKEEYKLMVDNTQLGDTIKIYKDSSLVSMVLVDEDGSGKSGQFLKYTYLDNKGAEQITYVDVSLLLSESEFKNGLQVNTAGEVSIKLHNDNEDDFLTVDGNGLKLSGVQNAIDTAVNAVKVKSTDKSINVGGEGEREFDISVNIKALSESEQLGGNIQLQKDADGALYGVMYYGGDDTEE